MSNEQEVKLRDMTGQLVKLTAEMLEIMESPEKNIDNLLSFLEQRQQVIDRIKQLYPTGIKETYQDNDDSKELLRLDSLLGQKMEICYQELRENMVMLRQRKTLVNAYHKKRAFSGGVFLDNRK